jgi:dCMP deaminase
MKEKFIHAHMKAAESYSELSPAVRLKVGCVIVKNDTIIGIGYNGMPSGWTNECEDILFVQDSPELDYETMTKEGYTFGSYKDFSGWTKRVTKPEVLHAETNALAKVAKSTNSSENADMFVTCAPCLDCSKLIHQSGIRRVFYKHTYRSNDGLEFLKKCGIETQQIGENNVV